MMASFLSLFCFLSYTNDIKIIRIIILFDIRRSNSVRDEDSLILILCSARLSCVRSLPSCYFYASLILNISPLSCNLYAEEGEKVSY